MVFHEYCLSEPWALQNLNNEPIGLITAPGIGPQRLHKYRLNIAFLCFATCIPAELTPWSPPCQRLSHHQSR